MSQIDAVMDRLSPAQRALFLHRLGERNRQATAERSAARTPDELPRTVPLSDAQRPMWYLQRLQPESCGYNVTLALAVDGPLELAWLRASLNDVVNRHASLRTTFREEEGEPVQVIGPAQAVPVRLLNLTEMPASGRDERIETIATRDLAVPFDLARGPLLRAAVLRFSSDEHVLIVEMHHIVCDAWSLGVLLEELVAFYNARSAGIPAVLPPLPIQLADLALAERQAEASGCFDDPIAYWQRTLFGLDVEELPHDRTRPAVETFLGAKQTRVLSPSITEGLRNLARRGDHTLFMVVQASFALLLRHWIGTSDVVMGTNISGRTKPNVECLIGLLLNTLVLRSDLADAETFEDILTLVRRTTLDAFAHAEVPFSRLVEALQPRRRPGHNPFFRVKLDFQMLPTALPAPTGLSWRPLDFDYGRVHSDLTLYAAEAPDTLHLVLEYSTDLFEATTIDRLFDGLEAIFAIVACEPDVSADRLFGRLETIDREHQLARERAFKALQRSNLRASKRRPVNV